MNINELKVKAGEKVNLGNRKSRIEKLYDSKAQYNESLNKKIKKSHDLQRVLYADKQYSLLFIFQAMDAGGKDSTIRHVMSGLNPQSCRVTTFQKPSSKELAHDFLWRAYCNLPERGSIGIFNRSYYEEVLIVKVHPEILHMQSIPSEKVKIKKFWENRYESICDLEKHLDRNGTKVVKFFLHISKEEQLNRLLSRIDNPAKNWKFEHADVEERKHWDDYMRVYESCMQATSTSFAPWYIIPADDKKNARLIVADIIQQTMGELNMHFPKTTEKRREELQQIRKDLEKS